MCMYFSCFNHGLIVALTGAASLTVKVVAVVDDGDEHATIL